MTIYIQFILFKSNWVWFEKYKSGISLVSLITKQTVYSIFHNRPFTLNLKLKLKEKWKKNEKQVVKWASSIFLSN